MPLTQVHCTKCLGKLVPDHARDAWGCVECGQWYTTQYLYELELRRRAGERDISIGLKAHYEMQIHDLNRKLHNLEGERDRLKFQLHTMQQNIERTNALYYAAKALCDLAHAGAETPDKEIESALTRLIYRVSIYETHIQPTVSAEINVGPNLDSADLGLTNDWGEWSAAVTNLEPATTVEEIWLLYEKELISPELAAKHLGYADSAALQWHHRRRLRQQLANAMLQLINKKYDYKQIGGHE